MINAVVVGAGFSGLATAWFLLQLNVKHLSVNVTIIDTNDIGDSASGIAAGLLHPYVGRQSKLNYLGIEGFEATKQLINIAEKNLGRPVAEFSGICRPCLIESQQHDFFKAANLHSSSIQWMGAAELSSHLAFDIPLPGIFIEAGVTVYAQEYLKGLWLACQKMGAIFLKNKINSINELKDYDAIICATGANTTMLPELHHLKKADKGPTS